MKHKTARAMGLITLLSLLIVAFVVCWPAHSIDAQLRGKLHSIKVTDGISESEAKVIAECYFAKNVGCGALEGIHDGGDRWVVDAKFGYGGNPVKDFYIGKHSGKVVSPKGPSYDDPFGIYP